MVEHVWRLEGMDWKNKRENWMQERRDNRDVKFPEGERTGPKCRSFLPF